MVWVLKNAALDAWGAKAQLMKWIICAAGIGFLPLIGRAGWQSILEWVWRALPFAGVGLMSAGIGFVVYKIAPIGKRWRAVASGAGGLLALVAVLLVGSVVSAITAQMVSRKAVSHAWLEDCEKRVDRVRVSGVWFYCREEGPRMGVLRASNSSLSPNQVEWRTREALGGLSLSWESKPARPSWAAFKEMAGWAPVSETSRHHGIPSARRDWASLWTGEAVSLSQARSIASWSLLGMMTLGIAVGILALAAGAILAACKGVASKMSKSSGVGARSWVSEEFKARAEERELAKITGGGVRAKKSGGGRL